MASMRKKNIRLAFYMGIPVSLAAVFVLFTYLLFFKGVGCQEKADHVVIAVPYSEWVQDFETNYFTGWLEEQTDCEISFVYLDEGYERASLKAMLNSENGGVDAVFFPDNQDVITYELYQEYIRDGLLSAPADVLAAGSKLESLPEVYAEVNFERLLGEDGRMYCFPSIDMARTSRNRQILWINMDWLTKLNLSMPRTTEELRDVLDAFRNGDPNGNGLMDELPLISCEADGAFRSYLYLLNAFTYYDESHLSLFVKDGRVTSGVEQDAFRRGVSYCASLYKEGLLVGDSFSYSARQLMELVNDPADTVGAFASHSIADVIYANNPGILSHFVQLAPVSSEVQDVGYAVKTDIFPAIGGLIPANASHKEAAARIMDVMLSEEASLIALYGEENMDWRPSRDGELSTYSTRAKVTTIRYLKGQRQNKNYAGVGPLMAVSDYTDGVTWNGDHSMTEYLDARAVKMYEAYYFPETSAEAESLRNALEAIKPGKRSLARKYLETEIVRFITGERDVMSDTEWELFLEEYRRMMA